MASDSLDIVPIRQEPSLEIVLRRVGKEAVILSYPVVHLPLCVFSILEVVCSSVQFFINETKSENLVSHFYPG